jgi:hypothetical protein
MAEPRHISPKYRANHEYKNMPCVKLTAARTQDQHFFSHRPKCDFTFALQRQESGVVARVLKVFFIACISLYSTVFSNSHTIHACLPSLNWQRQCISFQAPSMASSVGVVHVRPQASYI